MTQLTTDDRNTDSTHRKSMLYCFDCDHANPIDGDWTCHMQGQSIVYSCPDCGTTIAERPRSTEDDPDRGPPDTAFGRVIRGSMDLWRSSVGAGLRSASVMTHRNR